MESQEHELNAFSATTTSFNWAKVEAQDRVYAERLFREKCLEAIPLLYPKRMKRMTF